MLKTHSGATCDSGVRFLQLTKFDDLILKEKRVCGVVINWMPVSSLPRNITCVDPVALESKIVIDASGHDSVAVKRLMDRGYVKWKGMDPMWVEGGEDAVVNRTHEIFPGLISSWYGSHRDIRLATNGADIWFNVAFWKEGRQK